MAKRSGFGAAETQKAACTRINTKPPAEAELRIRAT